MPDMSLTLWVPVALSAVAALIVLAATLSASRRRRRGVVVATGPALPNVLIHSINEGLCTGCEACVSVCPTNVLALISHKSRVERFEDCVQCEACARVCPTRALVMHYEHEEPPPLTVPELDPHFQTAVPGQYLIGEAAGKPLVKNGANLGRAVVEHIVSEGLRPGQGGIDVLIVGSGPAGLSAALTCIHHGLSHVVLDKEQMMASTIARYPVGKPVMAEPHDVDNLSFLPVFDTRKEDLLARWKQVVDGAGVDVRAGEAVEKITRTEAGSFEVKSTRTTYVARRVVLAIGTRGKPRTLGVPGEHLPMVHSLLEDPAAFAGRRVLVVGGGDSALEAALALRDAGATVALGYRGRSFTRAKAPNKAAIDKAAKDGTIKVAFECSPVAFREGEVDVSIKSQTRTLSIDAAFVLIGADLPVKWLSKLGVEFVERPHHYDVGASDARVRALAPRASRCPDAADAALARVRGHEPPRRAASVSGLLVGVGRASARILDSAVARLRTQPPPPPPPRRRRPAATPSPIARRADTEVPIHWTSPEWSMSAADFDDAPTVVVRMSPFD